MTAQLMPPKTTDATFTFRFFEPLAILANRENAPIQLHTFGLFVATQLLHARLYDPDSRRPESAAT